MHILTYREYHHCLTPQQSYRCFVVFNEVRLQVPKCTVLTISAQEYPLLLQPQPEWLDNGGTSGVREVALMWADSDVPVETAHYSAWLSLPNTALRAGGWNGVHLCSKRNTRH